MVAGVAELCRGLAAEADGGSLEPEVRVHHLCPGCLSHFLSPVNAWIAALR